VIYNGIVRFVLAPTQTPKALRGSQPMEQDHDPLYTNFYVRST